MHPRAHDGLCRRNSRYIYTTMKNRDLPSTCVFSYIYFLFLQYDVSVSLASIGSNSFRSDHNVVRRCNWEVQLQFQFCHLRQVSGGQCARVLSSSHQAEVKCVRFPFPIGRVSADMSGLPGEPKHVIMGLIKKRFKQVAPSWFLRLALLFERLCPIYPRISL